jgi:hypothetical protein
MVLNGRMVKGWEGNGVNVSEVLMPTYAGSDRMKPP